MIYLIILIVLVILAFVNIAYESYIESKNNKL